MTGKNEPCIDQEHKKEILNCLLLEHKSWSDKLARNWQQRYILLGLNVAALGTLISLAVNRGTLLSYFLFAASFISSVLGLVWVAETIWWVRMQDILITSCIKKIRDLTKDPSLFGSDEKLRRIGTENNKEEPFWKHVLFGESPAATIGVFVFAMPSFATLVIAVFAMMINMPPYIPDRVLNFASAFVSFIVFIVLIFYGCRLVKTWTKATT